MIVTGMYGCWKWGSRRRMSGLRLMCFSSIIGNFLALKGSVYVYIIYRERAQR